MPFEVGLTLYPASAELQAEAYAILDSLTLRPEQQAAPPAAGLSRRGAANDPRPPIRDVRAGVHLRRVQRAWRRSSRRQPASRDRLRSRERRERTHSHWQPHPMQDGLSEASLDIGQNVRPTRHDRQVPGFGSDRIDDGRLHRDRRVMRSPRNRPGSLQARGSGPGRPAGRSAL